MLRVLVLEHGGINVRDHLEAGGDPEEVLRECTKCLADFHGRGVLHCDVKLENFLVNANGRYRLIDFGFSKIGKVETLASEMQDELASLPEHC